MIKNAYEAVLMNIAIHGDLVSLRYNDGSKTYTQQFAVTSPAYESIGALFQANDEPNEKTILKFSEFSAELPRRLTLTDADLAKTVLYDDKNLLSPFKYNFHLGGNALLLLEQTTPRQAEEVKLRA